MLMDFKTRGPIPEVVIDPNGDIHLTHSPSDDEEPSSYSVCFLASEVLSLREAVYEDDGSSCTIIEVKGDADAYADADADAAGANDEQGEDVDSACATFDDESTNDADASASASASTAPAASFFWDACEPSFEELRLQYERGLLAGRVAPGVKGLPNEIEAQTRDRPQRPKRRSNSSNSRRK